MKIGIFGSYTSASIGDHAILEGILSQFRRRYPNLLALVFSLDPAASRAQLISSEGVLVTRAGPERRSTPPLDGIPQAGYLGQQANFDRRPKSSSAPLRYLRRLSPRLYLAASTIKHDLSVATRIRFWSRKLKEIKDLDVLLIGGGQLLMDLFASWPLYPLLYVLLARIARVPVMFYAVGAGPIKSRRGRLYLRLACHLADAVTLRDAASLALVKRELRTDARKLSLSADAAVSVSYPRGTRSGRSSPLLIGMSVVPFHGAAGWPTPDEEVYARYIRLMAGIVETVSARYDAEIELFATSHPTDVRVALDVVSAIHTGARVTVLKERQTVQDLVRRICNYDLVVGTRLHSLILALIAGIPFLALAYQPKVSAFCRSIGLGRYVTPFTDELNISATEVVTRIDQLLVERDVLRDQLGAELLELARAADLSCGVAMRLGAR